MMPRSTFLVLLALAGSSLSNSPVMAAKKPSEQTRAAVVQSLSDCRKLTDDAFRLACYDKAAALLDEAEQQGQVVVLDREQVKTARRQTFGLSLPAFTLFNHGSKEDRIDNITLTIDRVAQTQDGKWIMSDADGVTWAQIDAEYLESAPHKGSILKIRAAAIGSYLCNIDGQRAIRCQRQR